MIDLDLVVMTSYQLTSKLDMFHSQSLVSRPSDLSIHRVLWCHSVGESPVYRVSSLLPVYCLDPMVDMEGTRFQTIEHALEEHDTRLVEVEMKETSMDADITAIRTSVLELQKGIATILAN